MQDMVTYNTVEGTGSAIDVDIGFVPSALIAVNIDGGGDTAGIIWVRSMGDGNGWKFDSSGPALSILSANGISALMEDLEVSLSNTSSDGDTTTFTGDRGFTIGADTDINVSGETIAYVAWR